MLLCLGRCIQPHAPRRRYLSFFGDFLAVLGEIDEDLDFWEYCRGNHIPP